MLRFQKKEKEQNFEKSFFIVKIDHWIDPLKKKSVIFEVKLVDLKEIKYFDKSQLAN